MHIKGERYLGDFDELLANLGVDTDLYHYGIEARDIDTLVASVMTIGCNLANTPCEIAEADVRRIYQSRL